MFFLNNFPQLKSSPYQAQIMKHCHTFDNFDAVVLCNNATKIDKYAAKFIQHVIIIPTPI